MITIQGEVIEIIYKNDTNGYTIAVIDTGDADEGMTIVGFIPYLQIGEDIKVIGDYTNHPQYGKQFKVQTFTKEMPKSKNAVERYLASGIIKGVREATAKRIVKKFGKDAINIIREKPEELSKIKGISEEKAMTIGRSLNEQWDLWRLTTFIGNYGIGSKNCAKLYNELGHGALEIIQENPYIILDVCVGVDFKVIDKMAQDVGYDKTSNFRASAGVKYALSLASTEGHTYLPKSVLIEYLQNFLEISEDVAVSGISRSAIDKKVTIYDNDKIYLTPFFRAESSIAGKVNEMLNRENRFNISDIETKIGENIYLTDEQEACVREIFNNKISIITGGPGTGKTTIIKAVIKTLSEHKAKIVLCAPTGRAAKRLSEAAGMQAKTIHRLLQITNIDDDDKSSLIDIDVEEIKADIVIVDETSMIDIVLMNNLLKAIGSSTMLVLVGDVDQLPAVGAGNVLNDLIHSEKVPFFALTQIFRQAQKSRIVVNAHNINEGEMPVFNEEGTDNFIVRATSYDSILENVINLYTTRLPSFMKCDLADEIQVITPMRKGALGANNLNRELQSVINPKTSKKNEVSYNGRIFRTNDKVMQVKNNYDMEWETNEQTGKGVFNGDIGRITEVDEENELVTVLFDDGKKAFYDTTLLEELDLAYATTVHKSQGCEYRVVIIPVFMGAKRLMTRNLLYTAMTRAKELLVFVGGVGSIEYMVKNLNKKERYSGLKSMLREIKGLE